MSLQQIKRSITSKSKKFWLSLVLVLLVGVGLFYTIGKIYRNSAERLAYNKSISGRVVMTHNIPINTKLPVNPLRLAASSEENPASTQQLLVLPHYNPKDTYVPVLMYHHVGDLPNNPDAVRRGLTVSTADFSAQVAYVADQGYQTITTEQLYQALQHNFVLPHKAILFTFDDGYDDVFNNAVPILKAHKMSGTFGIITGFVGTPGYATWQQIQAAAAQGMEIISHSYNHINFTDPRYTSDYKNWSIATSLKDLKSHLSQVDPAFIYPYGHADSVIQGILANNGVYIAFTTKYGLVDITNPPANLFYLPRVRVRGAESLYNFGQFLLPNPKPIFTAPAQGIGASATPLNNSVATNNNTAVTNLPGQHGQNH